jgi:hypothetical protein
MSGIGTPISQSNIERITVSHIVTLLRPKRDVPFRFQRVRSGACLSTALGVRPRHD